MRPVLARIAVVAVLLGGAAACATSHPDGAAPGGPASDPGLDLPSAVVGTWRPVEITGYRVPADYPDAFRTATITFTSDHRLRGSDGCNRFDVSYHVSRDGSIRVGQGAMTLIGCANVPNDQVTGRAARVAFEDGLLTFVDQDGDVLGSYGRVPTEASP
jgi:heat shock protein HslJ